MNLLQSRFAPLCILLLALVSFGVGLARLPVQDRDEARFAQASRQMAQTGDFIDIRLQDAPRYNKPVLIYWAQAAAIYVTGAHGETPIWVHRLPSYLAGAFSALALIWAGTPIVGRSAAMVAGIISATVFMFHVEARLATTDSALVLFVVLAMGALSRAWLNLSQSWATPVIFWTSLAAGVLLKGPVIALPIIGAIVWVSVQFRTVRWLTRLRPFLGFLFFTALVVPWFAAITIVSNGAFWGLSLGGDLINKITAGGEHSGSPPGFYLITMWLTFFPWSLLIPFGLAFAWRTRHDVKTAVLLGWLIPGWIMFELVPVKLLHYTMPLFPALMLFIGAAIINTKDAQSRFARWTGPIGTVGFLFGLAFFASISILLPIYYGTGPDALSIAGASLLTITGLTGLFWQWRNAVGKAIAALTFCGVTMGWTVTAVSLPAAHKLWLADILFNAMKQHACFNGPIAVAGYAEPSVVFRLGTDTILGNSDSVLSYLAAGKNRAAWIDPALMPDTDVGLEEITLVKGVSTGNFRPIALRLYVSPGIPANDNPCASSP